MIVPLFWCGRESSLSMTGATRRKAQKQGRLTLSLVRINSATGTVIYCSFSFFSLFGSMGRWFAILMGGGRRGGREEGKLAAKIWGHPLIIGQVRWSVAERDRWLHGTSPPTPKQPGMPAKIRTRALESWWVGNPLHTPHKFRPESNFIL
jgi:hypothetical protein